MKAARWIAPVLALVLAGCATGPAVRLASAESDAAAKQFVPAEGRANVYIARSNDPAGGVASFTLTIDGKTIGPIGPGTFYLVVVDPGKHSLTAAATLNSAKATLEVQAGKNYFYEITSTGSGLTAQPSLGIVLIEEMGKMMVRQDKRAEGSNE